MCQHEAMDHGHTKPDKDIFLSTADIIRQVELAQANPVSRWMETLRLYLVLGLSLTVGLGILALAWRAFSPSPRPSADVAAAHGPSSSAVAQEAQGKDGGGSEASGRSARPRPAPAKAAAASAAAPVSHPAGPQPLKITLLRQSGTLWLDGSKMAEKKHGWSGQVAPGSHQLTVRIGGQTMRHSFVVEGHPVHILVDPAHKSFQIGMGHAHQASGRGRAH